MRIIAVVLCAVALNASAASTSCPSLFAGGQAPDFVNASLADRSHVFCYRFYSVAESGVTRTGLWSAEHLTRASVARAHAVPRVDAFHVEESIPLDDRAEREDYFGSGMDEGHLSPSGDAPDADSQYETFSLGNMVPQSPDNNRHLWQGIEISTRALARYDGEVYVVTGPAFVGARGTVGGRVQVPTHMWKAIYDPARGAAAYVTRNRPGEAYSIITISELTRRTGIDPFPALARSVKDAMISLPAPRPNGRQLEAGAVMEGALGFGRPEDVSSLSGPASSDLEDAGRSRQRRMDWGVVHYVTRALLRAWRN